MDASILSKLIPLAITLFPVSADVKKWIDIGLPLVNELQKDHPDIIPILDDIGQGLFPNLKGAIHTVAAAADAIYDPNGVRRLQNQLNQLQHAGLTVDGSYGPLTKSAVMKFQSAHPPLDVDGWAGPKTRATLAVEMAKLA